MSFDEYLNACAQIDVLMNDWNNQVDPIKTKIAKKIQTKMNLGQPSNGRMVNPNLRIRK